MKKISNAILLSAFIVMFFCGLNYCQTYGKIYTKEEAGRLYGAVNFSIQIKTSLLKELLGKTKTYLLFNFIGDKLQLLDNGKKNIMPGITEADISQPLRVVSVSVVEELLNNGMEEFTDFEKRSEVLSISNGAYTLELVGICPPVCP